MLTLAIALNITYLGNPERKIGDWWLIRDPQGACSIVKQNDDGSSAEIANRYDGFQVRLFSPSWRSLMPARLIPITIIAGGQTYIEPEAATGDFHDEYYVSLKLPAEAFNATINNPTTNVDRTVTFKTANGNVIAVIPGGLSDAAFSLITCGNGTNDPFAKP